MPLPIEIIDVDAYRDSLATLDSSGQLVYSQHQPPTAEFLENLRHPLHFSIDHLDLTAYSFNNHVDAETGTRPPLVAFMSPDCGAASRVGSRLLNGLTTEVSSRIIRIDLPGTGVSSPPNLKDCLRASPDRLAAACDRILKLMGVEGKIDLFGVCEGAVIAGDLAKQRAGLSRSLLTYVSPGFSGTFLSNLKDRMRNKSAAAQACNASDKAASHRARESNRIGTPSSTDLPPTDVRLLKANAFVAGIGRRLIFGAPMESLAEDLSPTTRWSDWVGSLDVVTDWRRHYTVVAARNERYPNSSNLKIIKGAGHDWPVIDMPATAHEVELTLQEIDQATA